ncbi:helix-turn-helix domain-containing protein [Alistipes sp. OttesenSCG-928-B03]|nr:helix-turn-helix domain-containing protein [Alistipes sp. OttesenSCG-928-B03]
MYYFHRQDLYIVKQRIKEIAKEKGITMRTLAEKLDIQPVSLSRMLANTGNIPLSKLIDIANHLGVQLSDLFGHRDETQTEITGVIYFEGKRYIIDSMADFETLSNIIQCAKAR